MLAVQGRDDEYGTLAQIEGIARAVPRTELMTLDACGHSVHRDQPELLTRAVTRLSVAPSINRGRVVDAVTFLIQCLNAVQYGLLLFLVASGLTLIFGAMGIINLAHGSFYMMGAYFAYALAPGSVRICTAASSRRWRSVSCSRSRSATHSSGPFFGSCTSEITCNKSC